MYKLDKGLVDLINAQRAEAEEYSKQPGCFMGMMPEATELVYWESRVPSGTLKEYKRIELEESVYYAVADALTTPLVFYMLQLPKVNLNIHLDFRKNCIQ